MSGIQRAAAVATLEPPKQVPPIDIGIVETLAERLVNRLKPDIEACSSQL